MALPALTASPLHPRRGLTPALCRPVPQSTPLVVLPLPSLAWLLCKRHLLYGSYYSTGSSVRQYQPASRPSRSGARLYATMVAKDLGYCGDGMMIPFISRGCNMSYNLRQDECCSCLRRIVSASSSFQVVYSASCSIVPALHTHSIGLVTDRTSLSQSSDAFKLGCNRIFIGDKFLLGMLDGALCGHNWYRTLPPSLRSNLSHTSSEVQSKLPTWAIDRTIDK